MNNLEEDEEIIDNLEEIDQTFSSINRVLKEINGKILQIKECSGKLVAHSRPWLSFFGIDRHRQQKCVDVSLQRNEASPNATLHSFDVQELPEAFANEQIASIYRYVESCGEVRLADVYEMFREVGVEKMDIFVEMMIRKRFLGCSNGMLYSKRRSDVDN